MTTAYHSVQADSLQKILADGLRYGEAGAKSKIPLVQAANAFLDDHRPGYLAKLGISRQDCIYMYAAFDDLVLDIADGACKHWSDWNAGEGFCKLRASLDEDFCFISDLDAYDTLSEAFAGNVGHAALRSLAKSYWQRIVPLADFVQHYAISANKKLSFIGHDAPVASNLQRIEIMTTRDIAGSQLKAL